MVAVMTKGFYIWYTTYGTYAEPDVPSKLVLGPMPLSKAFEQLQHLGYQLGYCIKESS